MNEFQQDIKDDEIRIISTSKGPRQSKSNNLRKTLRISVSIIFITLTILVIYYVQTDKKPETEVEKEMIIVDNKCNREELSKGYVISKDTIVNNISIKILAPLDLTPSLFVGSEILNDNNVKMIFPAADIRKDNGGIVGAYVLNGELLSKGQAKSGFCAIIDGRMTIGVADATPLLEQALENNGYFFRQYPLVVGGQIVNNKPKGVSQRKALAEIKGTQVVISTNDKLTLNDFSQCLADLGVTNAIYLIGSTSYGFAKNAEGVKIEIGDSKGHISPNTNYIVWK